MEKLMHKYIKRIPKKNGKGWIYFYTKQDLPENKNDFWGRIMSFFGITEKHSVREHVSKIYNSNKEYLGISENTFTDYTHEYIQNRDEWDKKLNIKNYRDWETGYFIVTVSCDDRYRRRC